MPAQQDDQDASLAIALDRSPAITACGSASSRHGTDRLPAA
ncbi:MAG: hypothetical protein N838_08480 [Thiohalocapsa sp. PB-PSB1]|nr:MAG: hypothetical protein N838_08480 [Thiohalocapsa sp. PB-PSB1]